MLEGAGRESDRGPRALRALARLERAVAALRRAGRGALRRARGRPLAILVQIDWRLGDEVMALPVFEALRRRFPGDRIAARLRHPELLEGNPHVDEINPLQFRPDRLLDLRGEVAGEARRVTLERRSGVSLASLQPRVHLSDAERARPVFAELAGLAPPVAVLHPFSTQPAKAWGAGRWRALARALGERGVTVVEVGQGAPALGLGLDLVGRTGVRELARVLAAADLAIGEDSGPLHLALAVGTPAVGLFGPTDPALLYPPGAPLAAVVTPAACRSCWPRRTLAWPTGVCPLARHECMEEIGVEAVLAASLGRLGGSSRSAA